MPYMEISDIKRVNGYPDSDNRYVVDAAYLVTCSKNLEELAANADPTERFTWDLMQLTKGDFLAGDSYDVARELLS